MSKITELAAAIEEELKIVRDVAENAYEHAHKIENNNKEFKRRLIRLLDEFFPE